MKNLRGNPGKRKPNDAEPLPESGEPDMPEGLSKAAQKEWNVIVPQLMALKVLSKIDGKALGGYCAAYARWLQAERDVEKYGLTIEERVIDLATGCQRVLDDRYIVKLKKNPAISTSNEAMKMMKSFLIEFGMTPAARTRLRVEKPNETEDPLQALLKKKSSATPQKYAN
jgi:P27 family predicted phage terminase small subunit